MERPRVCLIVDNPLRDLDGLVLLGWTLAREGAEVFLVPMYQQAWEVAALCPDLVLVNYLRSNNQELVEAYSECGILVGVLDTEGGIFTSLEEGLTNLVARAEPSNVDLYCLWGQRQYDSFAEHHILPREDLYITGCPRYDFCAAPWKSTLPALEIDGGPMILVNTRFPVIFPRFQRSLEDEIGTMRRLGYGDSYIGESVRQCFLVWAEIVSAVSGLAKSFSQAVFVVRPHPFEDHRIYEQVFRDIPNVKVIREKTVLPWIRSSRLLIQKSCSTAVEASFMGVEPVSLDWMDAPLLNNEVVAAVSHSIASPEVLAEIVGKTLDGQPPSPSLEMSRRRTKVVDDWFCAIDGRSAQRVANAIMETIDKKGTSRAKRRPARIMTHHGLTKAGARNFAGLLGARVLGFDKYDRLRSRLLGRPRAVSKAFDLEDVAQMVNRFSDVAQNSKAVRVERVRNGHCRLKGVAHCSIRLSTS